jgi:hypothetical protein
VSPVGLNVLEYGFDWYDTGVLADALPHLFLPDRSGAGWLITKIQAYAGPNGATLGFDGHASAIAADGCLCLEPGGALRGEIAFSGEGARMIIEFWYRASAPSGRPPTIIVE